MAHSGDEVADVNQYSEQMLNELEKEYPAMLVTLCILYGSIDNHSRYL